MVNFLVNRLIQGKLQWKTLEDSAVYAKYCGDVLTALDSRGYTIDSAGNCVKSA